MYLEAKYLLENSTADEFEFTLSKLQTNQPETTCNWNLYSPPEF